MKYDDLFGSNPLSICSTPEQKPEKKKSHPENPPERMRREIDYFRLIVRPEFSIEHLDVMMCEALPWVGSISQRQRVAAQKRLDALIETCDFDNTEDPVASLVAATRGADLLAIREYQLAAVDMALECYGVFMRIVPCTAYQQDRLTDNFYQASLWARLWQELMQEHGDESPGFFI